MIYLKAKELESAYRGYDIEEGSGYYTESDIDTGTSNRSSKRRNSSHRSLESSSRRRRGVHFVESERETSDADSETSQSSLDSALITRSIDTAWERTDSGYTTRVNSLLVRYGNRCMKTSLLLDFP